MSQIKGIRALAGMGLEGATVLNEENKKQSTIVTVDATNPAQERESEIQLSGTNFLQQAGLQPSDYLGRFKENSWQFCSTLVLFQIIFVVLFAIFVDYDKDVYNDEQYIKLLQGTAAESAAAREFFKKI
ncbi:unnamed protein product [Oikopleura dioica]|uniref:Uncharacterized protein n=1 Tax=Oikopleura dioica TaxID=34765 RepID=E4X5P8_OIKDI|nr:unnamed protein product [Oikopleura dioica]